MKISKQGLWRVPFYCVAANLVTSYPILFALGRLAVDGEGGVVWARAVLVYGVGLAAILLLGGLVFLKDMNRQQLLRSASVMAAIQAVISVVRIITGGGLALGTLYLLISETFRWSSAVSLLLSPIGRVPGAVAECLMPFVFVLFGKDETETE